MTTLTIGMGQRQWSELAIIALLCIVPGVVWAISVGDVVAYFTHQLPAGQLLYIFSKLCALYAYFFMTLQIIIGVQGRKSNYFRYHPWLGALTTFSVFAHVLLFISGASLRSGHVVLDNLIPIFSKGFYKGAISIGVISAYGLILVLLATTLRRRWRGAFIWMHRLAFVVGILGWLHSFLIGTETRIPVVIIFYALLLASALYFLLKRVCFRIEKRIPV